MKENLLRQLVKEVLEEGMVNFHLEAQAYANKVVKGLVGKTLNLDTLKSLISAAYLQGIDRSSSHFQPVKETDTENKPKSRDQIFRDGFTAGRGSHTDDSKGINPYPSGSAEFNAFETGFLRGYSS